MMKASDRPKLSAEWWEDKCPADLDREPLERALEGYEKSLRKLERSSDDEDLLKDVSKRLQLVERAVKKTLKQCDRKLHRHVITVLRRFDDLIEDEEERLEQLRQDDSAGSAQGGGSEDAKLFERDLLYKMVRTIKSGGRQLHFAFGLNANQPEASDLLLHPKLSEYRLYKVLKKSDRHPKRMMTFGTAELDEEDSATLVLRLAPNAEEPPRLEKQGRLYLRSDRKLKFTKLKLVRAGGHGTPPEESTETEAPRKDQADGKKSPVPRRVKAKPRSDETRRNHDEGQDERHYQRAEGDLRQYRSTVLQLGSRGEAVTQLQRRLNFVLETSLQDDGRFGPRTRKVLTTFQRSRGITADGIVGPQTWELLDAAGLKMELE